MSLAVEIQKRKRQEQKRIENLEKEKLEEGSEDLNSITNEEDTNQIDEKEVIPFFLKGVGIEFYNGYSKAKEIGKEAFTKVDPRGFGPDGINIFTGTKYDKEGYDKEGYDIYEFKKGDKINKYGFRRDGRHVETNSIYGPDGYNIHGININGEKRPEIPEDHKSKVIDEIISKQEKIKQQNEEKNQLEKQIRDKEEKE